MAFMQRNNLLTLIVSLIISLIILEIGLRNFTPYPSYRVEHETLGYVMNPNMSDIDENGFRNKKLTSVDIVALGDSHTYGYNVSSDNSWPKLLGRKLKKNVYNFGVGGYGILQYQNLLSKAIELNPKVILLGLYLANDLNDICTLVSSNKYWKSRAKEFHINSSVCSEIKPNSALAAYANKESNISIGKWLRENSAIITIVSKYYHRFFIHKRINARELNAINKIEKGRATNAVVINDGKIKTMIGFGRIKVNKECMDMNSPHIQMTYEVLKEFFLESKKNTTLNNIHFGVLFIPSKARVFYEYLKQRDHCLPEEYEDLINNEDELKVMTSVFLENIGIPFIDVLPAMENALLKHGDIYPAWDDGHTVLTGYKVFAESAFNLYQQIISPTGNSEN
jgi:lysophospholipase L1-like esterase